MPKQPIFALSDAVVAEVKHTWDGATYTPPIESHGFPAASQLSPTEEEWKVLLEVSFCASLRSDEARSTRFRIAFQRNAEEGFGHLGFESELTLAEPVPFEVGDLVKLAHALPLGPSFVWVRRIGETGPFVMTGIARGWGASGQIDDGVPRSGPPSAVPIVEAVGTGELRVLKGLTVVSTVSSEALRSITLESPLRSILLSFCGPFVDQVTSRVVRAPNEEVSQQARDVIARRTVLAVERLARALITRGHGGMIAFMPRPAGSWVDMFKAKYRVKDHSFYSLGGAIAKVAPDECRLHIQELFDAEYKEQPENVRRSLQHLAARVYASALEECLMTADGIASLAGVDNAVVLDDQLRVWGFGAEIVATEAEDEAWWISEVVDGHVVRNHREELKRFGTRHRSCFRLCKEVPGTMCILVSQDGATKIIVSERDSVSCFAGVEQFLA